MKEILTLSFNGQNKEQIAQESTLNEKLLQKYLNLLLDLKLLKFSGNPRKIYYQITPTGKAFLNDLKRFDGSEDD
jgi:predicted transcriptional regulator